LRVAGDYFVRMNGKHDDVRREMGGQS
jgi:hypothetical protein